MSKGMFVLTGDVIGYEKITPGDTAMGISAGLLKTSNGLPVREALITVEANTVNFSTHGTAPTASAGTNIGHAMLAEQSMLLEGEDQIRNFSAIDRVSGSAGVVKVTTYA